jgi:hypothetical protein
VRRTITQEDMMPYNEELASRIREEIDQIPGLEEKKMFGGVGFLVRGNMAVGVHGQDLGDGSIKGWNLPSLYRRSK